METILWCLWCWAGKAGATQTEGALRISMTIYLPGDGRRWIAVGVLLLIFLPVVIVAFANLPRTYQSGSAVVLLASPAAARSAGGNPYLSFSPSLTLTAALLSEELTAPEAASELASHGVTGSYAVTLAPYSTTTTGSVLIVSVSARSAAAAEHSLRIVTAEIGTSLTALEAGERKIDRIQVVTVSMDQHAALSLSSLGRSLGIVVAGCLALAFAAFRVFIALDGRMREAPESSLSRHRGQAVRGAISPRLKEDIRG